MNNGSLPLVLMYHGILSKSLPSVYERETGAELYDVSLDNFKAQMKWLKDQGYRPVLFKDGQMADAEKQVIITFDDGEINNFHLALPVLNEYGWKAYFFIIVKRIARNGYMGWEEISKLLQSGMIVGSHGLSHEILTNLLDSQMEEELRASKKNLEINLKASIDTVSIPRGFCNDKVIETAYALGYKTVFISERPPHLKAECLARIAVKANWSLKRFDRALKGHTPLMEILSNAAKKTLKILLRESGYNWVRSLLIKVLR